MMYDILICWWFAGKLSLISIKIIFWGCPLWFGTPNGEDVAIELTRFYALRHSVWSVLKKRVARAVIDRNYLVRILQDRNQSVKILSWWAVRLAELFSRIFCSVFGDFLILIVQAIKGLKCKKISCLISNNGNPCEIFHFFFVRLLSPFTKEMYEIYTFF